MTEMLVAFARPVRHEANNLLAALSGTAEIMLRSPASTERDIARAERLRDGFPMPDAAWSEIAALARRAGVPQHDIDATVRGTEP